MKQAPTNEKHYDSDKNAKVHKKIHKESLNV